VKCAFCTSLLTCLRKLVTHLERCKPKKDLEEHRISLNEEQYLTIARKDNLCKNATKVLNQRLAAIEGAENGERLIASDTGSYSSRVTTSMSKRARSEISAPTSHESGGGDNSSGESAKHTQSGSTKKTHSWTDVMADVQVSQAEASKPFQKRQRTTPRQSKEQEHTEEDSDEADPARDHKDGIGLPSTRTAGL
jgi:hypothetical protein